MRYEEGLFYLVVSGQQVQNSRTNDVARAIFSSSSTHSLQSGRRGRCSRSFKKFQSRARSVPLDGERRVRFSEPIGVGVCAKSYHPTKSTNHASFGARARESFHVPRSPCRVGVSNEPSGTRCWMHACALARRWCFPIDDDAHHTTTQVLMQQPNHMVAEAAANLSSRFY